LAKGLLRAKYTVRLEPERLETPGILSGILVMSQHRSLRAAATLGGKRNVLKRFERIELLKKRGQWKDGERITGLRKTKGEA
jgi:small basic protein (TIGR04137 family)